MTELAPGRPPDDGLQAERTALSWTRTSVAVLANGVLLMLKDLHSYSGSLRLVPVGLAVTVAISTHLIGMGRQRTLGRRPLPQRITPRREVNMVGISLVVLTVITTFLLLA